MLLLDGYTRKKSVNFYFKIGEYEYGGIKLIIRRVEIGDAKVLLDMQCQLDQQTKNMMFEADERPRDISLIENQILSLQKEDSLILIAEEGKKIVGFLQAQRGTYRRIKHSAYIVVGILIGYRGLGIGRKLFKALDEWAKEHRIMRLELTVMCHNTGAIALYKKNGFEIEGIRKHSMCVEGKYVDEYYMAKVMDEEKALV